MQEIKVGVTSIGLFSSCRHRWWLERSWRSKKTSGPMYLGSLVHAYLEGFYRAYEQDIEEAKIAGELNMVKAATFELAQEAEALIQENGHAYVDDLDELARAICDNYVNNNPIFFKEILAIEEKVEYFDDDSGVKVRGRVDMLVRLHDGRIALVDHKVRQRKTDSLQTALTFDNQVNLYAMLANPLIPDGEAISVVMHNILYARTPEPPAVLKNGSLSRAKATLDKTTLDLYLNAIDENGLDANDYSAELVFLEERETVESPYFDRVTVEVYPEIQERLAKELYVKFSEMRETVDNPEYMAYRNNTTYNCRFCPFLDICYADLMGLDTNRLLVEHYSPVKEDVEIEVED